MDSVDSQLDKESDKKLVSSVKRVEYAFLLRYPPYLNVSAEGQTNTGGWSEPELRPRKTESPVSNGILELDFLARPPDGMSTQVLAPVHAEITWEEDVYAFRGVKVYSATNDVKVIFADQSAPR